MEECQQKQVSAANLRQKGRNCPHGRVLKGCVQDAGSKVSIGSIPSTYEAIIYRNNSAQAFGSSSFRFHQASDFVNIAPNHYKKEEAAIYRWKYQQGFNRKGTCPFISKEKRVFVASAPTPGPGNYQISASTTTLDSESSSAIAAKQQHALTKQFKRFSDKENYNPGPGDYNPKLAATLPPGWKSSFQSKVTRDQYLQLCDTPGPGAYEFEQATKKVHRSPDKKIVTGNSDAQQIILKLLGGEEKLQREPVGDYPDFQPKYSKIKNSPIFMEGAKDRFGDVQRDGGGSPIVKQEGPGPGSYQPKSEFRSTKQQTNASFFASETIRNVFDGVEERLGPNVQQVFLLGRKRFHLNLDSKWV